MGIEEEYREFVGQALTEINEIERVYKFPSNNYIIIKGYPKLVNKAIRILDNYFFKSIEDFDPQV